MRVKIKNFRKSSLSGSNLISWVSSPNAEYILSAPDAFEQGCRWVFRRGASEPIKLYGDLLGFFSQGDVPVLAEFSIRRVWRSRTEPGRNGILSQIMTEIVLINPAFETSYWGLESAVPLFGKRANVPPASLPLLAALTPQDFDVTLIDENVEALDFDRIVRADIVGVTGMSVQRFRVRQILENIKQRGGFTVVGGPWVTVQEDYFGSLADVIFVGEAEETWPRFLGEWKQGRHQPRYEQLDKTDMSTVPAPRLDLLNMNHYMFGSAQFSRGCPFQCEFCDIIVTFGRRPRIKSSAQVIDELERLRAQKMEIVFVVDDNLIGNKAAMKKLLRDIGAWQQANGYPLMFFTEASLDLADDDELMQEMVAANFVSVFIGIESPNEASLRETKKFQNLRNQCSMIQKVRHIQDSGLDVWCGMIVGFDHDDPETFAAHQKFIQDAQIAHAMIGMLYAVPKTPLYERLAAEHRLDMDDDTVYGTNVIPLGMTREDLTNGYIALMLDVYSLESYFERLDQLFVNNNFRFATARARYWRRHPWQGLKAQIVNGLRSAAIAWRMMREIPDEVLRREYRRRIFGLLKRRWDPSVWFSYVVKCAMHYHHYSLAHRMTRHDARVTSTF
jgi:radical SAM superfamily enzyme YgiQ (UPF0313 family)